MICLSNVLKLRVRLTCCLLLLTFCLSVSGQPQGQNADLARFTTIALQVADLPPAEKPDARIREAQEILIKQILKVRQTNPGATDAQIEAALKPFHDAANGSKEANPLETTPTWFQVHMHQQGDRLVIAVTYGPYSLLRIQNLRTGQRMPLPAAVERLYLWKMDPHFTSSGSLIILSESIQDLGIRIGVRVDFLHLVGSNYIPQKSIVRTCTLEWGGLDLKGDLLIVQSLDSPQAFFTANSETLFKRKETYRAADATLERVRDEKQDTAFRALDAWLFTAQHTTHPDANQRTAKRALPDSQMLDSYSLKKLDSHTTQFDLDFGNARLRMVIQGIGSEYQVISVQTVKPDAPQERKIKP